MIDLNTLAAEIHAAAVEKGFWDVGDAIPKHIAKLRSELGEVIQADRIGMMYDIERDGAKPEGVAAELADFVMMALDWFMKGNPESIKLLDVGKIEDIIRDTVKDVPAYGLVNLLYSAVEDIGRGKKTDTNTFVFSMIICVHGPAFWLEQRGYNLWEIIRAKMEYNRSRPKLHGRAY